MATSLTGVDPWKMNRNSVKIDTYKSYWLQDMDTGNYIRIQKETYPLEMYAEKLKYFAGNIPKVNGLLSLLGRKPQGVDFYKYYSEVIKSGKRFGWVNEFEAVYERLVQHGMDLDGKSLLDVSGEPGYFGKDAGNVAGRVVVTAFAREVAEAIRDLLQIEACKFDFQADRLSSLFEKESFDMIFVRYAIGFCEDLEAFLDDCAHVMKEGGLLYISFCPASRAVCARWMFDDYTYLRQYTGEYMAEKVREAGFTHVAEWDEGSYFWHWNRHPVQRLISKVYTGAIFAGLDVRERMQHNLSVLCRKHAGY